MNNLNISKIIVTKRKEKGITQDEFASHFGITKASVSKWETGQSFPDITFLPEIASYFNITIDELMCYEPQMFKGDIKNLYHRICKDFTWKPFDKVVDEIREITKKYYSCFPLLLHLGLVLINHSGMVTEKKRESIINEAAVIFIRIQSLCKDIEVCRKAKDLEALCYLLLNKPSQVIDLMQESTTPMLNELFTLSQGYLMAGQKDKATEALQIGAYQNLLSLIQYLLGLLSSASKTEAIEIERRITEVSNTFQLEILHPAIMFNVYLTQAQASLVEKDENNALVALQKYVDLATSDIYPIKLHGDNFFNQIDAWFSELDLGIDAPQANSTVKSGIVAGIKNNPIFSSLSDNTKYKFLIEKLSLLED